MALPRAAEDEAADSEPPVFGVCMMSRVVCGSAAAAAKVPSRVVCGSAAATAKIISRRCGECALDPRRRGIISYHTASDDGAAKDSRASQACMAGSRAAPGFDTWERR